MIICDEFIIVKICYNLCMILIIQEKATKEEIKKMAEDFGGDYIKVVVDIERKILAGGGERHADAEQILLQDGSKQEFLWGGGFDPVTLEIDYNSMINLRPGQGNLSREIQSTSLCEMFNKIVKDLLL